MGRVVLLGGRLGFFTASIEQFGLQIWFEKALPLVLLFIDDEETFSDVTLEDPLLTNRFDTVLQYCLLLVICVREEVSLRLALSL